MAAQPGSEQQREPLGDDGYLPHEHEELRVLAAWLRERTALQPVETGTEASSG
jgi:hypothetical protein